MAYRGPSHFISGRLEDLEDPDEDRGEDEGSEGSSDEDELSADDVIRWVGQEHLEGSHGQTVTSRSIQQTLGSRMDLQLSAELSVGFAALHLQHVCT